MKFRTFGQSNSNPSTSVANYVYPSTARTTGWFSSDAICAVTLAGGFTLSNWYLEMSGNPGASKSWDIYIMKNGSRTAMHILISGAATSGSDPNNSVSFVEGDTISIEINPTGTPGNPTNVRWYFDAIGPAQVIMGGSSTAFSTSAASFSPLNGGGGSNTSATEALMQVVCPIPGIISKLYVGVNTAPGVGKTYDVQISQNGAVPASSLDAQISGTGITGSDTNAAHNIAVLAGDTLSIKWLPAGTPASPVNETWSMLFTPNIDGYSWFGFGNGGSPSNSATNYESPFGNGSNFWTSNATAEYIVLGDFYMKALYVKRSVAPGAGKTFTNTIYNSTTTADTPLTIDIADTNTTNNIVDCTYLPASTDRLMIKSVPTGTPTASTVRIGVALFARNQTDFSNHLRPAPFKPGIAR